MSKLKFGWVFAICISFAILVAPASAVAKKSKSSGGPLGVGVILGEPTGLTGKYWQSKKEAIDFGLTYSFGSFFLAYGDYLWHWHGTVKAKGQFFRDLSLYLGVGGVIFIGGDTAKADKRGFTDDGRSSVGIGARIPLGAEWRPRSSQIGVFAELVPGLGLIPAVYAFLQGGIGIRYYF